ncbi:MAG: hypothetical protein M0D55_16270 [Elusimicrobiota bacterium]|nr:MAG: hypothetical protein M0D55_16270 [Elusimicrobiota bacterium]
MNAKKSLSIFCCLALMSANAAPAFAQVARAPIGGTGVHMPAGGVLTSPSPIGMNPALTGGVSSIQGSLTPNLAAPSVMAPAVAAPALAVPAALAPVQALPAAVKPEAAPALAIESAKTLAAASTPEKPGDGDAAKNAGDKAFDGSAAAGDVEGAATPVVDSNGQSLSKLYPRVVFIQDVFQGAASENTVSYINKLVEAGAHVVFLTWRPTKGAGSAEEVLMSRVKQSRNNPVVVVSYNGGKISLHGRAANPKPLIESVGAFPADALAKIKKIGGASVAASPADNEAFSVTVALDASVAPKSAISALNRKLKAAGLDYKAEQHPTEAGSAIIHSMPLRFSLPRVMQALDTQFAGEKLSSATDKFLILADSVKSPKFSTSFPKNAEIQVVQNGASLEHVIGAVLGERTLEPVSLKLGKLRQFIEYWEPSHRRVQSVDSESGSGSGGGFGGGSRSRGGDRETNKNFAMYVGTIMYSLMAQMYDDVFRGQHQLVKLTVLQARLRDMWYNPLKHGIYVNKGLAMAMRTPAWKAMSRGYLEYANSYLTNYYFREFGDYSRAARNVQENYVGLSTDRKSLITLDFVSAATGKLYKIHTRIPRVMRYETASGLNLTAYAYRTGKETPDDGEEFLARMLAMAMLKGHARKGADGKWHHGSPDGKIITNLNVQLEYRTSARLHVFDTEDFLRLEEGKEINGPIVQEMISAIEREEADAAYQEYYKEQEQQASKEDLKKPRAKKKAVTAKTAKPAAKKPTRPKPNTRTTRKGK